MSSAVTFGPQKGPACFPRLRAQWRQIDRQNAEAREVRRQWMTELGVEQETIDEACSDVVNDLDLVRELEQLGAVKFL